MPVSLYLKAALAAAFVMVLLRHWGLVSKKTAWIGFSMIMLMVIFNGIVTLSNGGKMPSASGWEHDNEHQQLTAATRYPWLADIYYFSASQLGLMMYFSLGDLCFYITTLLVLIDLPICLVQKVLRRIAKNKKKPRRRKA